MNKNEGSALAAEHLLEQTHHHKADTAANATRGHLTNNRADIHPACARATGAQHGKHLTADAATQDTRKRVAERA